jgi:hypothetical protein
MRVGGQRHAPAALPPGETRYPLHIRLGGPRGRSGWVRKISPPPGFDPRTVQPVMSRNTDWAIPAHLCRGERRRRRRPRQNPCLWSFLLLLLLLLLFLRILLLLLLRFLLRLLLLYRNSPMSSLGLLITKFPHLSIYCFSLAISYTQYLIGILFYCLNSCFRRFRKIAKRNF